MHKTFGVPANGVLIAAEYDKLLNRVEQWMESGGWRLGSSDEEESDENDTDDDMSLASESKPSRLWPVSPFPGRRVTFVGHPEIDEHSVVNLIYRLA